MEDKLYTATGTCGMKKGLPVTGTLTDERDILTDYKNIPCSINIRTLREANEEETLKWLAGRSVYFAAKTGKKNGK